MLLLDCVECLKSRQGVRAFAGRSRRVARGWPRSRRRPAWTPPTLPGRPRSPPCGPSADVHTGKGAVIHVCVRSCVCLRVPYLVAALRKFSDDVLREARFGVDLHTSTWRVVVVNGELS